MKDTKTITIPAEEAEEIAEDIYDAYVQLIRRCNIDHPNLVKMARLLKETETDAEF
jgi:prolyl-tRNA synthetase